MNPIRLSIIDTKYETDNKTFVRCILTCKLTGVTNENKIKCKALKFNEIAKLHKNDVFDYSIGCKIALAKAERKAYKICGKVFEEECKYMNELYKVFEDFAYKAKCMVKHNTEYIKNLAK